ncbi:tetratricopeptide repeat-containing sensor histidine kinase [Roseivirga echinicomitans]
MRILFLCAALWLCTTFKSQGQPTPQPDTPTDLQNLDRVTLLFRTQPDSALFYLYQIDTTELNSLQTAKFYEMLGISLMANRDFDKAVSAFSNALSKLEETKENASSIARILDLIGTSYNNDQKQFNLAESYFLDALKIREVHKLTNELNTSYYNLGTVYFRKSQHNSAIQYFKKALKSINGESQLSLAANLNYMTGMSFSRIGSTNNQLQNFDSAVYYLSSAKKMYSAMSSPYMEGVVTMEQAGILVELGKNQESIDGLNYILNEPSIPKTIQNYVRIYGLLSKAFANLNDFEKAFTYKKLESDSLRADLSATRLQSVAEITEDYRTDKQLDKAEETAFFASRRARGFGFGLIVLAVVFLLSYLLFSRALQAKKLENLRAMILGEENERKRVAKDLHDGIGVLLTSIKLRLSNFEDKVEDKNSFKNSLDQIDNACTEVRRISHNMVPASLSKLGLAEAMLDLFDNVSASTQITIHEKLEYTEGDFDESSEVLIYRVIQELVNNTLKYAQASIIQVELKKVKEAYFIEYSDNGIGFDKVKVKNGLGLKSIASRIDILKGGLTFDGIAGKGVNFKINIPLQHGKN